METLSLRLFGDVKLLRGPTQEIALPRKTQLLLAYLALNAGQRQPRDKLAALLWQDRPEEQARQSLRQCLFTLGKALGDDQPPLVLADRNQLSLDSNRVDVDVWRFERHVAADSPEDLERAATLYGDDLLADLTFDEDSLDAWCAAERTRLHDRFYEALATLTSHYVDTLNFDAAIETGRRLVGLDPLREDAHRSLMRIYQRVGRRADALKQYRLCVDILRRELNVEPEAATTRLYHEIRRRRDEADASPEQIVPPPHDRPRIPHDGLPGILQAAVRRKVLALVAGLALFLTLAGIILWLSLWRSEPPPRTSSAHSLEALEGRLKKGERYLQVVHEAAAGFTLEDAQGRSLSLADYRGKVVVLNFVYAGCLDVCPLHAERIAEIQETIEPTPMRGMVQFITVTTDPANDTPEVMKAYGPAHGLDPVNWVFLTSGRSRPAATREIAWRYGLKFTRVEDDYLMHGLVTFLIDRSGNLRAKYHGLKFKPAIFVMHVKALADDDH